MSGLTGAIGLLTKFPMPGRVASNDLARSVPWLPVVGALIGGLVAAVYVSAESVLPPLIAATLATTAGLIVTGAFHEDGLADVVDAFAGGWSREQRLEILDDPRLGTFGVLALTSSFLLRVGAIGALDARDAVALIPAAHALSRVGGVLLMRRLPLAVPGGLGASYAALLSRGQEFVAVSVGTAISAGLIAHWSLAALVLCGFAALAMGLLARAKIGGIGGDVLGATQQVGELAILLLGVVVVRDGAELLAWWWR